MSLYYHSLFLDSTAHKHFLSVGHITLNMQYTVYYLRGPRSPMGVFEVLCFFFLYISKRLIDLSV